MNNGMMNRLRSITIQMEREDLLRENGQLKAQLLDKQHIIEDLEQKLEAARPKPFVKKAIPGMK